jgi:tRNA(Ile)-lysidine synthase
MEGKSMKISDLMINEKIPSPYRELWPLVVNDDTVIWVPGGRLSHQARITKDTKTVMKLAFLRERA